MRRFERQGAFVVEVAASEARAASNRTGPQDAGPPALNWHTIGKERDLRFLSVEEVRSIHQQLFDDFLVSDNPIDTPGTRSEDLLASACARPLTSHGSTLKYPTVEMAAAALAHSIVNNHPFWNGNKRTALVSFLVFLDENGLVPTCTDDELFRFVLKVAQHRFVPRNWPQRSDREVLAMAEWTRSRTRPIERGERIIKWHQLKKVLGDYGAWCEQAKNVGNRMNVYRDVRVRGPFGIGWKTRRLHVQITYGDDGREVDRNAMRKLRSALLLDDEHGVDSRAFYSGDPRPAGDFILEYRRILRRLAKL